jgi:dTDP-L-rhamnose 4-epimerase
MKILITGGAGFIGSNLSLALLADGHEITVIDSLEPQIHGDNPQSCSYLYQSIASKVNFVHGSVTDKSLLSSLLPNAECVVHLAAETGTGQSMYQINRYVETNIVGTANILDYLTNNKHGVKKFIVASSRAIYGEGKYVASNGEVFYPRKRDLQLLAKGIFDPVNPASGEILKPVATDELSMQSPSSVYGLTKQTQENIVLTVCAALNISAFALRYQNVYGPGQSLKNPYTGILSIFSTRILSGNDIDIYEDGLESRDFVYISDVVKATKLAIESEYAGQIPLNVGTGNMTTVKNVAELLCEAYGIPPKFRVSGAYRIGDIRHNFASLEMVNNVLNYSPSISTKEGINSFAQWVRTQDDVKDVYDQSLLELKKKGMFKE